MDCDFLIIGGGVAGLSAGARLSHLGRVILLEAESALGYHASGRSAAMFEETYGMPSTIALNRASKDYLMHENGGVLSPRGLMILGQEDDRDQFAADMVSMEMDPITIAEAKAIVPILNAERIVQAGHHAAAWDIDTDLLLQNFAREIRSNGGQVVSNARVTEASKTGNGWEISAGAARYSGAILFNAAGAWADEVAILAGIAPVGLVPHRRSMARIAAPGGHDVSNWPMMFGAGETWYAKPDAGKLIVSPADAEPSHPHDAWADDMVLAEGLDRYQQVVTEPVTRIESNWAGLRTFAPDKNLVLGFEPTEPTFFWVAGQGGYGFQSSPGASQLVADIVAGCTPEMPPEVMALVSPNRFRQ